MKDFSEEISDFTALGDSVNTTARLASLAAAGELLVSVAAAESAGMTTDGLDRRTVDVRGRRPVSTSSPSGRRCAIV